jgi:hypothetical protein
MVQMRVGQDDRGNLTGREWKFGPIAKTEIFQPLKQAAVHEDALSAVFEKVLRPGDGAGCTKKGEIGHV